MKILVTNDDGIKAEGLKVLAKKALKYGEVVVVAPKREQSGKSQSMRIRQGIKCKKIKDLLPGVTTYYVDSTPTDCVRLARYYLGLEFSLVLSGVNNGYNLGEDIFYSGTVGAASEAALYGLKALALSCPRNDFSDFENNFDRIMDYIEKNKLFDLHSLYNINFVRGKSLGIRFTKQGSTHYQATMVKEAQGVYQKGKPNFDLEGENLKSDVGAIHNKYISITPLSVDRTKHAVLEKLGKEIK